MKSWHELSRTARAYACASCSELSASPDERRVEPTLEARRVGPNAEQPVRDERLRLSLRDDRLCAFELERTFRQLPCRVSDEDVSRLRRLLEPRGDVDRVARRERAALARHDLAGVDAHAHLQLGPELALEVRIETTERLAQLVRGACSPERVVLVHDGDTEDRHDCIADELFHRPAVPLEHLTRECEVTLHHTAQRL